MSDESIRKSVEINSVSFYKKETNIVTIVVSMDIILENVSYQ